VEAQAQMKYHHSERCFTYRMKRPNGFSRSLRASHRLGLGLQAGDRFHGRLFLRPCSSPGGVAGGRSCRFRPAASWGPNRAENCTKRMSTPGRQTPGLSASLVSRHLPDGEFGWGGISVTRQRRCPKASSVGTELSRGTQA
jgi:hypothetical protein